MSKLRWLAVLMIVAITGITGFQAYWLKENYTREKQTLDIKTSAAFRQTILRLQASKLRLEQMKMNTDSTRPRISVSASGKVRKPSKAIWTPEAEPPITIINLLQEKSREFGIRDSGHSGRIIISGYGDSLPKRFRDSSRQIAGEGINSNVNSFVLTGRNLDSLPPGMIKEVRVRPDIAPQRRMTVQYNSENSVRQTKEDFMFEGPMPPPSDLLVRRISHDSNRNAFVQLIYSMDSLSIKDSVTLNEVDSAFAAKLKEETLNVSFAVSKMDSTYGNSGLLNEVTVGLSSPVTYKLSLLNSPTYILKQLQLPILFSLLLVGITIASFVLLYRNLLRQHRLSQMKNDLISNITHELKTPIATVGVAIEALKNFNAMDDPKRTKEYLDISQNELQRLELLVDKVLKLSMFENKQIALQKEVFNLEQLITEVIASMRFQVEKQQAKLTLESTGDRFSIRADKLHITSVIYNLLDNALKYSKDNAVIKVQLISHEQHVEIRVSDNGIGIPPEYKNRIFDKFFRVPSGDKHTIKGYGLGLSYVDHIIKTHHGYIGVESELDKGSTFIVNIPYDETKEIDFRHGGKVTKEGFSA